MAKAEKTKTMETILQKLTALLERQSEASTSTVMKTTVPKFMPFNENDETFDSYIDRLELYFKVQNVPDSSKVDHFVSLLPLKMFESLKNTLYPAVYSSKTYAEIIKILRDLINPKPLIMSARYKLHCRKQKPEESCEQFLLELRKLSVNCAYSSTELDLILLNAFIFGLRNKIILDRVLEEPSPTLEKARTLVLTMEAALIGASDVLEKQEMPKVDSGSVKKISTNPSEFQRKEQNTQSGQKRWWKKKKGKPGTAPKANTDSEEVVCFKCRKKGHKANKCTIKVKCTYCGRPGHTENYCRFKQRNENGGSTQNSTNAIEVWPTLHISDEDENVPSR